MLYPRQKESERTSEFESQTTETDIDADRNDELEKIQPNDSEASENTISAVLWAIKSMETKIESQFSELRKNNNDIIKRLQSEIGDVRKEFTCNNRMEGLIKKVESKVCEKVQKSIDEKVQEMSKDINAKSKKLEEDVNRVSDKVKKIEERIILTMHEELGDEIDALNRKIREMDEKLINNQNRNRESTSSFIIHNLPERQNKTIVSEANILIKDGLKLKDIRIEVVDRKENYRNDSKPGVIVAKCMSKEDKQVIMKNKSKLKDNRRYERL